MMDGLGVTTGVELNDLIDVSECVFSYLNRHPASRVANALIS